MAILKTKTSILVYPKAVISTTVDISAFVEHMFK